ncbi:hypothetical protein midi_00458 [Candidatus Midichloria mitochondrii IricVA]|uniref:Uncharacterized protein n=1 Tax=Midichloria mitochondrii (strain IricVA) TaxID=696127 RepID=F7XVR6_MIDMI|nr:hypothetical protein midi_00458 [Candidatus Midichloria mitochondrii IricVA]
MTGSGRLPCSPSTYFKINNFTRSSINSNQYKGVLPLPFFGLFLYVHSSSISRTSISLSDFVLLQLLSNFSCT